MTGDSLERLNVVVAWELFRKPLAKALNCSDRSQAPTLRCVMMLKILVLQAFSGLSDEQAECQIMDRRTFGRFLGLLDGDRVDAATTNTGSEVWADTAYRSNRPGFISRVHRKKPRGRQMRKHIEHGDRTRSRTRAHVEHAFTWWQERSVPA